MDPLLIVSPHLDDAVLSTGQLIAGRTDCVVVTLFAGIPADLGRLTSYDRDCGFYTAAGAVQARRGEDRAALGLLNAKPMHLGYADEQYREPTNDFTLFDRLTALLKSCGAPVMLAPLGLGHPDHVQTRRVVHRVALARPDVELWLYEELPYRVLFPESVHNALDWWQMLGFRLDLSFVGEGPLERKAAAIDCYVSQLWALNRHACLVPERFWKVSR